MAVGSRRRPDRFLAFNHVKHGGASLDPAAGLGYKHHGHVGIEFLEEPGPPTATRSPSTTMDATSGQGSEVTGVLVGPVGRLDEGARDRVLRVGDAVHRHGTGHHMLALGQGAVLSNKTTSTLRILQRVVTRDFPGLRIGR
jgi:hypothetical protein